MEKEDPIGDMCKPLKHIHFDMKDIFPLFLDLEYGTECLKVTPSCFIREMEMTTQERHRKLLNPLRKHKLGLEPNLPPRLFKLSPNVIIFQRFITGGVYSVNIGVRNSCEMLKPLRMEYEASDIFTVSYASEVVMTRIAPGMSVSFIVKFSPQECKDYYHKITFVTDEEIFSVPIMAIGPRPLLDFPDHVYIPSCPVRVSSSKSLTVRNIGQIEAVYTIITQRPFSVEPKEGIIEKDEWMQVTITFKSEQIGEFEGKLILRYETGEELFSSLHGSTENADVYFEEQYIWMKDTYMNLSREQTISIHNRSDHILFYKWKKFANVMMESAEKERLRRGFKFVQSIETKRSTMLETFDVIDYDSHRVAYERIYDDEVRSLENEDFIFDSSIFSIQPLEGELWPHSSSSIMITFKPLEAENYKIEAFCEIGGIASRISVMLHGLGQGPCLKLNLEALEISYVFISGEHCYEVRTTMEVVVTNQGHIPGTLIFCEKELSFGGKMSCKPMSVSLQPEECKSVVLTFSSNRPGQFVEDIDFQIKESSEIIRMVFKGTVVSPTLHFDRKSMEWGIVAIGFPSNRRLVLHNLSHVQVAFKIRILYDGFEPAYAYRKFATFKKKPALPKSAKEFKIKQDQGIVPAFSDVTLQIQLTPNIAREWTTSLMVDMWDSKSESVFLPLKYSAKYATIVCQPAEVNIKFCFINFPYSRIIVLQNHSKIPGFFHLVPQKVTSSTTLTYSTTQTQGVLKANEKIEISLTIMTNATGQQSVEVYLLVMGATEPLPCCTLICNGQGPVLSVVPLYLNWGETFLLEESTKELTLINDSPIPAAFNCVNKNDSPWQILPNNGTVHASGSSTLKVTLYLKDTGHYSDKLQIHLVTGKVLSVQLTAKGIGTSLYIEPKICPVYDMGSLYSHSLVQRELSVTNKGKRHHQLMWSSTKTEKAMRYAAESETNEIFRVTPAKAELFPGESVIFTLEGKCDSVISVSVPIYCFAIIEKVGRKTLVLQSEIQATFIEPLLQFSKSCQEFLLNVGPEDEFISLEDTVGITNMIVLPLNIEFNIDYPFTIKNENGELVSNFHLYLEGLSHEIITISFDPTYTNDIICKIADGYLRLSYKEHPNQDNLPLKGEVNFPNITITPDHIDFGCISVGTEVCKHTLLTNVSPLPVKFRWCWIESSIKIEYLEPVESGVPPAEMSIITTDDNDKLYESSDFISAPRQNVDSGLLSSVKEKEVAVVYQDHDTLTEPTFDSQIDLEPVNKSDFVVNEQNDSKVKKEQNSKLKKEQKRTKKDPKDKKEQQSKLETITTSEDIEQPENKRKEIPVSLSTDITSFSASEDDVKNKLFPIIDRYFVPETEVDTFCTLSDRYGKTNPINEIFDIVPCRGTLDQKSMEYIAVSFHGNSHISAEATAICGIVGGPAEVITIRGIASNISYYIDTTFIDFGHQVFCEVCQTTITLYNTGYLEFEFTTDTIEPTPDVLDESFILEVGMLVVEPKSGRVPHKSKVELTIRYFPGISGKFNEQFQLQISYLLPIKVNVEGYGVFPQLYFLLPHPAAFSLPVEIGYTAIASLTPQWLSIRNAAPLSTELSSIYMCHIPEHEVQYLQNDGWVVYLDDYYPPVHEIDLAIERIMAYQHIENNSTILLSHTTLMKSKGIPELVVPPYLLDFGLVVVDTSVCCSVAMYKYGPVPINVSLLKNDLIKYDIAVHLPQLVNFPKQAQTFLQVTFSPKHKNYPDVEQELNCLFYLEVHHGARIPFYIHSIVTIPCLKVSKTFLNFEQVKCGECKIMTLILRNEGLVPCKWEAFLAPVIKKYNKKKVEVHNCYEDNHMEPVFSIKHTEDTFSPSRAVLLEVFFQPQHTGTSEMNLILSLDQNPNNITVLLKGEGIEPQLFISDTIIHFSPVVPFTNSAVKTFFIENPCPFPVEFYFPDFDSQVLEEERILRILAHYYKTNNLLVPIRNPGQQLPKEFYEFYQYLIAEANSKLILKQQNEETFMPENEALTTEEKKLKHKTSSKIVGVTSDTNRDTSEVSQSSISSSLPLEPMSAKDPDEIEVLLHEYVEELLQHKNFNYNNCDPLHKASISSRGQKSPEEEPILRDGLLIIFHGAPLSDYLYLAHRAAKMLGLLPLNIDQVILEAAASATTLAAMVVRDHINKMYTDYMRLYFPASDEDSESFPEKGLTVQLDSLEKLTEKAKVLESESSNKKKPNTTTKNKKGGTLSNKHVSKQVFLSEERSCQGLNIGTDLLNDILEHRLQMTDCQAGVVIDSLHSSFFANATIALNALLKAVGNIKYIHCIILYNTFTNYTEHILQLKKEKEEELKMVFESRVKRLEKMGDDEIDNLSEENVNLYNQINITKRKEVEKKIKERLLEVQKAKAHSEHTKISKGKIKKQQKRSSKTLSPRSKSHSTSITNGGPSTEKKIQKFGPSKSSEEDNRAKIKNKKSIEKVSSTKSHINESVKSAKSSRSKGSAKSSKNIKNEFCPEIENATELFKQFEAFELNCQEIITLLENWNRKKGISQPPTSDRQSSAHIRKSAKRPKHVSDIQGQVHSTFSSESTRLEKISSKETALQKLIVGIPLWIAQNSNPGNSKIDMILQVLKGFGVQKTQSEPLDWSNVKEPEIVSYSQLNVPPVRKKTSHCEIFTLEYIKKQNASEEDTLSDSFEDTSDVISEQSIKKVKHSISRKRSSLYKTEMKHKRASTESEISKKEKQSSVSVPELAKFKSRWILLPEEKVQFKMKFFPKEVGEYSKEFMIELVGWNNHYSITGCGQADVPHFDTSPSAVFTKVVATKLEDIIYTLTYFTDSEIFDFGAVLSTRPKEKRLHQISTDFRFHNCSLFPDTIHFDFEKSPDRVDAFGFEPAMLNIEPTCTEQLTVWACPHVIGEFSETILCSIKDNPRIHQIKVICQGVKPDFEVDTKTISFENMPLYRKQTQTLNLTNKCIVPLLWRFVGVDAFRENFGLSPTTGILQFQEKKEIRIEYRAEKIQFLNKIPLKLEVYDDQGRGEPLYTEVISVSAEAYDVAVEVFYALPHENHVNFGTVKIGTESHQPFILKNRGKYDVLYRIFLEPPTWVHVPLGLDQILSVAPTSGTVFQGEKTSTIQVMCKPGHEFQIQDSPLFNCYLIDTKNDTVIAVFPINVSVATYFSRYEITPRSDLNFGAMIIGVKKTMELCIQNVGFTDFKYVISKFVKEVREETKHQAESKKGSESKKIGERGESRATTRGGGKLQKSTKVESGNLPIGVFMVNTSSGEVKIGDRCLVFIVCNVDSEGTFSEEIVIQISESIPEYKSGTHKKLMAVGCVPTIDFADVESIFQEHYLCRHLGEFECPLKIGSYCVYVKEDRKLMFCRTCVDSETTARIRIKNTGLVPCEVSAKINVSKEAARSLASDHTFCVNPSQSTVAPYSMEYFTINFTPSSLEMYTSDLEIGLESTSGKKEKFIIKLCGEGNIPQVTITAPKPDDSDGKYMIKFPRTVLGHISTRQLEFKNKGITTCQVIIEMSMNLNGLFFLYPTVETIPLMKTWNPDKPILHTTLVDLNAGQTVALVINFEPHELGCFKTELKLTVVNNPYENLIVNLFGESYIEDITMDGLESSHIKTWVQKRGEDPKPPMYHIKYGMCYINKMNKYYFKLTNHSALVTYRFEWSSHPNILFSPNVGHIYPRTSKDVVATFLSSEPVNLNKVPIKCTVSKIILSEKIISDFAAWDDRQNVVKWIPMVVIEHEMENVEQHKNSKILQKTVETEEEPEHEVVDGTIQDIPLFVSALADYSKYECVVSQMDFEDTLLFQKRDHHLTLKNDGVVPLEYKWQITVPESYPIRPHSVSHQAEFKGHSETSVSCEINEQKHELSLMPDLIKRPTTSKRSKNDILQSISATDYLYGTSRFSQSLISSERKTSDLEKNRVSKESSIKSTDLFSRTAQMSDRTSDTWIEDDFMPFSVTPDSGILKPFDAIECIVTFSPHDIFEYKMKLICNIFNLDPNQPPLEINLNARSLLPYYHFDLEESDYLKSGRRNPSSPGPMGVTACSPLNPATQMLEFEVLGIGITCTRKFCVINPTKEDYSFSWQDVTLYKDKVSSFHCSTLDGWIGQGKKFEMEFAFVAQDIGISESFWNFCIRDYNITTPFLLVGTVMEPSVYFLTPNLNLCPTIIGVPTIKSITMVNNEDISLSYYFKPETLYLAGQNKGLSVNPMSGSINPNSDEVIQIKYNPTESGRNLFMLMCYVKRLLHPLQVSVATYCYKMQPLVTCSDVSTKKWNLSPSSVNIIDFGSLIPTLSKTMIFNLTNLGKHAFHFGWIFDEKQIDRHIIKFVVLEKGGFVPSQSRVYCKMNLTFLSKYKLENFEVTLQIPHGPEYKMLIQGSATMPQCEFSTSNYDFGPCMIQHSDRQFYTTNILLSNKDKDDIVLECLFENKPHMTVQYHNIVKAKQTVPISICFRPREQVKYKEKLQFNICDNFEKYITVCGEGAVQKVVLLNPQNKYTDFGSIQLGQSVFKSVQLTNKSRAPATVSFGFLSEFTKHEDKKGATDLDIKLPSISDLTFVSPLTESLFIISPTTPVTMSPKSKLKLMLKFSPLARISYFTEKVYMQINDYVEPLCIVKGCCIGSEFSLDRSNLSFGTVVQNCTTFLKVSLMNVGDIGSRFSWNCEPLGENFSLNPTTGYCSPGTSVTFSVEFHPSRLVDYLVCEVICELENFIPLTLTLTGSCVPLPTSKDEIHFTTPVRQEERKTIPIHNRFPEAWELIPIIKGDYFSGSATLTVPPHGMKNCNISYLPLTMTQEDKHKGSVLFKFPDGQVLLYDLIGTAELPLSNGKIFCEISSKTTHTEFVRVKNWLQTPQRFKFVTELVKAEKYDPVYTFTGKEFITVPGNSESDYGLKFHAYRECNLMFKVIFLNENGGEYQFYDLSIKVVKCPVLDVITLKTCVRNPVTYDLKLENPLATNVNFNLLCSSAELIFPSSCSVSANSVMYVKLEYLPLHPGESIYPLDVNCLELGNFPYEVNLQAAPPPNERPVKFLTALGSQCKILITFQNPARTKADFLCKVDNTQFYVDKSISVAVKQKGSIEVIYEPSTLEGTQGFLTLSSVVAGEFVFPLIGTCTMPKPQGPLILKPASSITIPFKNPFSETKVFSLHVDLPVFKIKNKVETIKSHQERSIKVSMQNLKELEDTDTSDPVTGKLVISCNDPLFYNISWVYYLKGISE